MKVNEDEETIKKLDRVLKIIELLGTAVKKYSELKFKKI